MKLKPYTYTFNFITHILVHLAIVNTLEQSFTLDMSVKIKSIIIIIIIPVKQNCIPISFIRSFNLFPSIVLF